MIAGMPSRVVILTCTALLLQPSRGAAQTYLVGSDLFFYGDNTEFANPFRAGDTTLGISGYVFLDAVLNDVVSIRAGLFGLGRFGAHEFLEHAEPAVALHLTRGSSRFIFGTLDTVSTFPHIAGPDQETPHRLLPPLQQETLSFTRGQEMGLQWLVGSARVNQDAWINWQRVNTSSHRERFDAGYRTDIALTPSLRLHGQYHLVHEGGQRFNSGAVRDSHGAALGLQWSAAIDAGGTSRVSLDGHAVATRHVPDREHPERTEGGAGIFTRAALQRGAWRTHLIVWRGRDTLKDEGDPNFHARRRNGSLFRQVRDYAEWGLTRQFRPAPGVHMFAAFRIHRVESHYEYSYRINARVRLRHKL
jgi:hypothetical protein